MCLTPLYEICVIIKDRRGFMGWRNALVDGLPEKNEEVLISIKGVNYQAIYRDKEKKFEDKMSGKFFSIFTDIIYWQKIGSYKTSV
jgi:hypothetical protein